MRRFALGVLTLMTAAISFFGAIGANVVAVAEDAPAYMPFVFLAFGICFVALTVALWVAAIRSAEGEDLFSGERGRLVSAMIVATLAIGLLLLVLSFNIDSWRGFIDGWRG